MKRLLACLLVASAGGCPDVKTDSGETSASDFVPTVEFDPARSLAEGARYIPFPTDLVRDAETGKIALSAQACESATSTATRVGVLNTLDGFGTYQVPIQVTFNAELDEATLTDNVALYQVTDQPGTAESIPIVMKKTTTVRLKSDDCTNPEIVNALVVVPRVPLKEHTRYVLALKRGIRSTDDQAFGPSFTWALVSAKQSPVTLDAEGNVVSDRTPLDPADETQREQLRSLFGLWRALAEPLAFLDGTSFFAGHPRSDLLVATSFTTQTIRSPLDESMEGSPASQLSHTDFLVDPAPYDFGPYKAFCGTESATNPALCFMKLALGGCAPQTTGCSATNYSVGDAACNGLYACQAIGSVMRGQIGTINFQRQVPNPTSTLPALQSTWDDPLNPTAQGSLVLETIVTTPAGTAPAGGWPVVIFGHGLGRAKEDMFAIAGKLAVAGFATVAIDTSQHGSRAVRTSTAVTSGCIGHCYTAAGVDTGTTCDTTALTPGPGVCDASQGQTCGSQTVSGAINPPSPTSAPQCYDSIFSADLAAVRDNIRQTVLDYERVARALAACGTTNCGTLKVDAGRIYYGGQSLGSLIGATAASMSPVIKGAALNVGGVGWLDVIENTMTPQIQCALVNKLVDAGVLMGEKWNPVTPTTTDICTTGQWKTQPGYATFSAIARWILDPADAANFVDRLLFKPTLIQSVVGDTVVPNIAQQREGGILNLFGPDMPGLASSPYNPSAPLSASAAISTNPTGSKYVTYTTDAMHIYTHGSLLKPNPATSLQAGAASARMQIDFAQFLDNIDDNNLP